MKLNTEISKDTLSNLFGSVRAKSSGTVSKKRINLMKLDKEKEQRDTRILLGVLAAVLLLAFAVFGVLAPYSRMAEAESRATQAQDELLNLQMSNADYAKIAYEYERYYGVYLNESESLLQNRCDILNMLERVVMPAATITKLEIPESNRFTIRLSGISVRGMQSLIERLEQQELVAQVSAPSLVTAEEQGTSEDIEFELTITVVDSIEP